MFGLTFEKLLVIAVIAAIVVGPHRLPRYAERLGELVRGLRAFMDTARERTVAETGMTEEEWKALDPRRYDPRKIVREALDPAPSAPSGAEAAPRIMVSPVGPDASCERPDPEGVVLGGEMQPVPTPAADTEGVGRERSASERRMKWVVVGGSSGHPRRMLVEVEEETPQEADAGVADAGVADAGVADAGVADAGVDVGVDAEPRAGFEPEEARAGSEPEEARAGAGVLDLHTSHSMSSGRDDGFFA